MEKLKKLREIEGKATGLISFYTKANESKWLASKYIKNEISEAANIKNKSNRKNVTNGLKFILRSIKEIKQCDLKNGVAIFTGCNKNDDFISEIIFPPKPIRKAIYSCGKTLLVEPIIKLYETFDNYGIVLISGDLTEYYLVNNTMIQKIESISIVRNKKQKKGGQSSQRFQRIRLNQINEYTSKIYDKIVRNYIDKSDGIKLKIKGLIIGGFGNMKDNVVKYIQKSSYDIPLNKIIKTSNMDIKYVISQASNIICGVNISEELEILNKFNDDIKKEDMIDLLAFGENNVKNLLENCMLKEIIVHNSIVINATYQCKIHKVSSLTEEGELFLKNYQGIVGYKWY